MATITAKEITDFIEDHIGPSFHEKRLKSLENLRLEQILRRKNPYLYKAKNINTAGDFVKILLDAHLSSQEETIFGGFLEELAIFICGKVYGGHKSGAEGIDLEFDRDGIRYIVAIKSGPHWGNSSQIRRMVEDFKKYKKTYKGRVEAINGCCYGRDNQPNKGDYQKLCGQRFWEFISGIETLYTDIIQPLGYRAKEKNEAFASEYAKRLNCFTRDFIHKYCEPDGTIQWEAIVRLASSK
ncbi:MAG: PmeII family type II restriction endonuclease [Verrucomicrobiae bacterium]|nr:PmeII family type II restriction endonuclease [Verrucomicrobiae bacterium]